MAVADVADDEYHWQVEEEVPVVVRDDSKDDHFDSDFDRDVAADAVDFSSCYGCCCCDGPWRSAQSQNRAPDLGR